MTIKKLSTQNNEPQKAKELDFWQGLTFGLGFMVAMFIFSVIIVPAIFCSILIALSYLGVAIGGT